MKEARHLSLSLHETELAREDAVRHEEFMAGRQIGQSLRDALNDAESVVQDRVAREIVRMVDGDIVPASLAQGMWHGFDEKVPLSVVRGSVV